MTFSLNLGCGAVVNDFVGAENVIAIVKFNVPVPVQTLAAQV